MWGGFFEGARGAGGVGGGWEAGWGAAEGSGSLAGGLRSLGPLVIVPQSCSWSPVQPLGLPVTS